MAPPAATPEQLQEEEATVLRYVHDFCVDRMMPAALPLLPHARRSAHGLCAGPWGGELVAACCP